MPNKKVRAIAFYLPQFYPTPENDKWWGPGFTEWTNVTKAKPLFEGHYQPRLPQQLSFYDLRVPETREAQAQLAREAGIEGFCYWHYWFGNGKRLLDQVFKEVVDSGKPDFPFCLCWANHTWYNKFWTPDQPDRTLIEQTYPGVDDFKNHFYAMLNAFKDPRYIKVNGKLLFGFFEPWGFDIVTFKNTWNQLAEENGLGGFHFFDFSYGLDNFKKIDHSQYESCVLDVFFDAFNKEEHKKFLKNHKLVGRGTPQQTARYEHYCERALQLFKEYPLTYPCVVPGFDHSPRSGLKGHILYDATPEMWGKLLSNIVEQIKNRPYEENLLFIKAWNEWGEGNYLEPDLKYGKKFLIETKNVLCK